MNSRERFYNLNPLLILPFNNPELLPEINTVIIDNSMNWSLLPYKEDFHVHRQKLVLDHGLKRRSKELVIFNHDLMTDKIISFHTFIYNL
jgi:hypothetical protein